MSAYGLRAGMWACVDQHTEITASVTDESVTLTFGDPDDNCEVCFHDAAVDRLIETVTNGRDRMRAERSGD